MTVVSLRGGLQPESIIQACSSAIDDASSELRVLNLEIYKNPEILFQETKACRILANWLECRGWTVTRRVYGIDTAFEARFSVVKGGPGGNDGRTICFNAEYDALPGVGHACGHNLIATSTLASAVGVKAVMEAHNLPGTVVVMGTPAEESGGGKWIMANNGAWQGFDACVMTHGWDKVSSPLPNTLASWKMRATFRGKSAHASAAPWTGRNACDAIVQAYNGTALLRQQIRRDESIQGVILEAGKAANLIPDFSEGVFSVRAPKVKELNELKDRVSAIFEGAAQATGCKVEIQWTSLYEDILTNETLAEQYRQYMIQYLGMTPKTMLTTAEATTVYPKVGSSDFGSCSHICPGIQAVFDIGAKDAPHSALFHKAAGTQSAHAEALRAGKANALIGLDVLTNDEFANKMKQEFREAMQKAGRGSDL